MFQIVSLHDYEEMKRINYEIGTLSVFGLLPLNFLAMWEEFVSLVCYDLVLARWGLFSVDTTGQVCLACLDIKSESEVHLYWSSHSEIYYF